MKIDQIERVARSLCTALGNDPDVLVQLSRPKEIKIIATPIGEGWHYKLPPVPLWTCWESQAKTMIEAGLVKE